MKTLSAVLLALAVMAARVPAQNTNSEPPEFKAIRILISERHNALLVSSDFWVRQGKIVSFKVDPRAFAASLQRIKTDDLPTPIRLAWFDYVQAWKDRAKGPGLGALIELVSDAMHPALGELAGFATSADTKNQTHEAWVAFERACLADGLDITRH